MLNGISGHGKIEQNQTGELLSNYNILKENMELVDDDFNNTTIAELSIDYLNLHIKDIESYLNNDVRNWTWKVWSKAWLYIYKDELLRRRVIKINKIKNGLT